MDYKKPLAIIVLIIILGAAFFVYNYNIDKPIDKKEDTSSDEPLIITGNISSFDDAVNSFCFNLFRQMFNDPNIETLFLNVLGGITKCDDVSKGIIKARNQTGTNKQIVVRMMGTNEDKGKSILAEVGIETLDSMDEAANRVVDLSKGGE